LVPKVTPHLPFCHEQGVRYRTMLLVVCATVGFLRSYVLTAVVSGKATSHCRLIWLLIYQGVWYAPTVELYGLVLMS